MIIDIGSAVRHTAHTFLRDGGFPFWTIGMLRRGQGRITTPLGACASEVADTTVLIRPRTPYRLRIEPDADEAWAIVDPPPSWIPLLTWPEATQGVALVPQGTHRKEACQAFAEAEHWWSLGIPQRMGLATNAIERLLMLLALGRPDAPWADLHPGIRVALTYMASVPAEKVTVRRLANMAGMSSSYFSHTFVRQIGESPLSWLEHRRIERARNLLLTTNLSIKSIAQACGFSDGEHFSHRFRMRTQLSPSVWRQHPTTT